MKADRDPVHNDYLAKILTAQVYDVAIESPLELAPLLSRRLDNRLLLKREDMQAVFSFKLRGAYNKMAHLDPAVRARGVIAASAGNHAQGVALAAHKLASSRLLSAKEANQRPLTPAPVDQVQQTVRVTAVQSLVRLYHLPIFAFREVRSIAQELYTLPQYARWDRSATLPVRQQQNTPGACGPFPLGYYSD